jgi:uncharacterized protein YbjQ (UPF0145 family)
VSGEAILGANIFRDMFAGIRDIVGGRSAAYEQELRKAKQIALDEMEAQARDLGADAILAVDLDYETIQVGGGGGMLMVSASGDGRPHRVSRPVPRAAAAFTGAVTTGPRPGRVAR